MAALWLLCCAAVAFAAVAAAKQPAAVERSKRPNIVFVLLDDVRYDDVVDHPFVRLPNIEKLAAEGASFTNFFTSAPLCSPSRAVFLTGKYPFRNGIIDNGERAQQSHELVTFPRLLHAAGYRTGFFGKWHMGHEDDTARPGFDRWVSFVGQGVYFDPVLNIDGQTVRANGYMTDILTEQAVSFIESSPADKPFMVFLAHKASHPEVYPNQIRTFPSPAADRTLYEANELPRAPNWRAPLTGKPALAPPPGYSDPRSPPGGLPDEIVKGRLRMLSAVDRGVGELRAALEKRGVLENTVFVVTSDQGFFYGEFGLAQERRLAYEASIRIPLVIRYPGLVKGGSRPGFLVGNVDIAPTMMDIAGVRVPRGMDGKSMIDTLKDPATPLRDALLIEYYSDTEFPRLQGLGYQAIRTNRYKYIRYRELRGADELYDLNADPYELDNLLPEAAAGPLKIGLNQQLERLLRSHGSGVDANRK
jgi:arylsulfatase A-like enzyme